MPTRIECSKIIPSVWVRIWISTLKTALLLLLFCIPPLVRAENGPLQVSLRIQSAQINLAYPNSIRRCDISRLDVDWYERLNSWLDGSIQLGRLYLDQNDNPIPAGQSTSGDALGLGLHMHLYRGKYLRLQTDLNYQYTDTTSELSGQTVDIHWHQLSGQFRSDIRLYQYSYLRIAVGAIAIHGDERNTGTLTSVESFSNDKTGYIRLGFILGLDPASHIGLEVDGGAITGERISFQRWF